MLPLALSLLALSPAPLADPLEPMPIVGGTLVEPDAYPEVLSIIWQNNRCTGTLMAPRLVLTAAHCLPTNGLDPSVLIVSTGDLADAPDQVLPAEAYGLHPDFCGPTKECAAQPDLWDFGWIRLASDAPVDPSRFPTVLTDDDLHHQQIRVGASLRLVGYGRDDVGVLGPKREVTVPLTGFTETGYELFAGQDGKDSCDGDSGGPAFAVLDDGTLALAGVLSRGSMVCGTGGVYGATLAGLCWAQEQSGVSVLPASCGDCGCVDLTPRPEEEEGCGSCRASGQWSAWAAGLVCGLVLLSGRRRRA